MKDNYMVFVLLAVLITPFLPNLLKAKCPDCGKRKLDTIDFGSESEEGRQFAERYITGFSCRHCQAKFWKEKSGPLKPGLPVIEKTADEVNAGKSS
jgi:hypothetical protein